MIDIVKEIRERGGAVRLSEILSSARSEEERARLELLVLWKVKNGEIRLIERGGERILTVGSPPRARLMGKRPHAAPKGLEKTDLLLAVSAPPSSSSEVLSLPGVLDFREAIAKVLQSAREIIRMSSPFIDYPGVAFFLEELRGLAERRVRMRLLTRQSRDLDFRRAIRLMAGLYARSGFSEGFEARSYLERYSGVLLEGVHAKLIISDSDLVYIGSGELRAGSYISNFELGVIAKGYVAEIASKIFDSVWKRSVKIQPL